MDSFKRIVLAASVGEMDLAVLEASVAIAQGSGAQLTLLDVFEPLPSWRQAVNVEGRTIEVQKLMLKDRQEQLRELIVTADDSSDAKVVTMLGRPFIEVIRYVTTNQCDLVIVGEPKPPAQGHHRGVRPQVMQLLRKCPVPVWVLRPAPSTHPRVLALIDPDDRDPVRSGLNDLVMQTAISVARTKGTELHVATAWHLPGEATLRSSAFVSIPPAELDLMLAASQEEAASRQNAFVSQRAVPEVETFAHLVYGAPNDVLPSLASELEISLIVMGTVARTGLSGLIMGNTAETILRSVDCSVLALKPEGFVSPVQPHEGSAPS